MNHWTDRAVVAVGTALLASAMAGCSADASDEASEEVEQSAVAGKTASGKAGDLPLGTPIPASTGTCRATALKTSDADLHLLGGAATAQVGYTIATQLVSEGGQYFLRIQVGAGRVGSAIAVISEMQFALAAGSVDATGALTPAGLRNVANLVNANASTVQGNALRLFNAGRLGFGGVARLGGSIIRTLASPTNILMVSAFVGPILIPMLLPNITSAAARGESREETGLRLMFSEIVRFGRDPNGCRRTPLINVNTGDCRTCMNQVLYTQFADVRNIQEACANNLPQNRTVCDLYRRLVQDATSACGGISGGYLGRRGSEPTFSVAGDPSSYLDAVCPSGSGSGSSSGSSSSSPSR